MYSLCPWQMWMSVWRGPTTATSMLSARTPNGRTSASASLATQGMVNTAKVRPGGHLEEADPPEKGKPGLRPAVGHTVHYVKACSPDGHGDGGWWVRGWGGTMSFHRGSHSLICTKAAYRLAEALVGTVHGQTNWAEWEIRIMRLRPEVP